MTTTAADVHCDCCARWRERWAALNRRLPDALTDALVAAIIDVDDGRTVPRSVVDVPLR